MKVLGIHDGHNASACLLEDGIIRYCIQEERLTNKKNYSGFPRRSILKILELAGISLNDIDYFAIASNHVQVKWDKTIVSYKKTNKNRFFQQILTNSPFYSLYKAKSKHIRLKRLNDMGISIKKIIFVDHHQAHAAAAYYGCPWWIDEDILILTNDGSGDDLCATVSIGKNGNINLISKTNKGNSIGNLYSNVTFLLGLTPWEHEWKVMGLAPYASPHGVQKSYSTLSKYLKVDEKGLIFKRNIPEPTHYIYPRLRKELELHRFDAISGGVQQVTEELLERWVKSAVDKTGIRTVALSGGVFMNVKANKRILELDCVKKLFVFPSCGDESNSIGAAFKVYADICQKNDYSPPIKPINQIYYGGDFSNRDVEQHLHNTNSSYSYRKENQIEKVIAELVSDGNIIARCKGRMEFGARALGNRSIIADPMDLTCIRTINMMVKKRDFWMPFAPVMTSDRSNEYIINPKRADSPYMMLSFDTTSKRTEFMAGVHSADLTARAQILKKDWNPDFFRVLNEFDAITGRGVLLNTSFNLHGYPLVNGSDEALWVFQNSGLDYLALGDYLIYKE